MEYLYSFKDKDGNEVSMPEEVTPEDLIKAGVKTVAVRYREPRYPSLTTQDPTLSRHASKTPKD